MVDFDLGELSAPLEALRPEVKAAYKRLDSRWQAITNQLRQLSLPCSICYQISSRDDGGPEGVYLEYRKWKGIKRICIVSCWFEHSHYGMEMAEDVTPYEEWSGEQRVDMLRHVPDLFRVAVEQVKRFVEQTKDEENA